MPDLPRPPAAPDLRPEGKALILAILDGGGTWRTDLSEALGESVMNVELEALGGYLEWKDVSRNGSRVRTCTGLSAAGHRLAVALRRAQRGST